MRRFLAPLAIALGLIVAMPLTAGAQQQQNKQQGKGDHGKGGGGGGGGAKGGGGGGGGRGGGGGGGGRGGGGTQQHAAPQRSAPQRAAPQRSAPQRAATPHFTPHRQTTTINRIQRQERAVHHEQRVRQPRQAVQPATRAIQQTTTRQQQRQERALRSQENRALRGLPANQRAQRRQEIQRAREQRALQRQQVQPSTLAQPNAATANTRAQRRALRRNRAGAVTAQSARQGRFASAFANRAQAASSRRARHGHYAARRAWRHGLRAGFVPWYGPVFWPYAYSDIFDYAFWPYGYDDDFWAYAYDNFIDSLFWGEQGPPDEYVDDAVPPPSNVRYAAVEELCTQPGTGITAWPFAEIESKLALNADQKALLGDVRDAANKAASTFKASCPAENAFPLTPPGRLRAMTGRLQATLEAVETVRPALEKFYNSLSDEQKERFNKVGPAKLRTNAEASAALPSDTKACAQAKPGLTNLPIEQIDEAVKPNEDQEKSLDALETATDKAVAALQAACPDETPLTPPGRLQAMETRLKAMVDAANTVKPALDDFYASLSGEQKARFNRIGSQLAKSGG